MKKFIKYSIFIFLLGVVFCNINPIKAKAESFYEAEYIDNMWMTREYNGAHWYQKARFFRNSSTGKESYCLDPFALFSENGFYVSSLNYSDLSPDTINKIKLAAYYGYGYSGHTDSKWYAITQLLIWRYAIPGGNFFFTDGLDGNRTNIYDNDIISLINQVESHYTKPSFNNSNNKVLIGDSITLTDTNNVLGNYYISNNGGLSIDKSGNSLTISANKLGEFNVTLNKASNVNSPTYFYTSSSSQNMMIRGDVDSVGANFKITVEGGYIVINKVDRDNNSCNPQGEAGIDGAIYDIYDDNKIVDSVTINNCYAKSKALPYGNYSIVERTPGVGYQKDEKIYYAIIDGTSEEYTFNLTNKVIKRKIELTKLYGSAAEEDYKVEPNITFGLYDKSGNHIDTFITNKSGYLSFEVPYGHYTLKQLNTTDNYDSVDDINIIIDEKSDNKIHYVLKNNLSKTKIKLIKKDKDTKNIIINQTALFKIRNIDTGKYLYHIVDGEKTDVFRINKDGYFITDDSIEYGKYEIIELIAPNGYKKSAEPIIINIDSNSNFDIDEDGNKVLEITIYNEKQDLIIEVPDTNSNCNYNILDLLLKSFYEYKKKFSFN